MSNSKSQFKNVTHVIFDLDGLMIDTETWALNNLNRILKSYGKECSLELYGKHLGVVPAKRAQGFIDEFELTTDSETFLKEWIKTCTEHLEEIKLMPGVERLVLHLHKHKIPFAIATSGKKIEYFAKTKLLQHIFEEGKYFNHIVHGDDSEVKHLKPEPDLFQVCASKFTPIPDPQNILVFEDSEVGVSAAVVARMQCVMVCDTRFAKIEESKATLLINSIEEFKPELFNLPEFGS